MYCVYKHTCPNGKVYIGMTKKNPSYRWSNGFGYKTSPHFWNAIQKYGWENIKHEVVETNLTCEQACAIEQKLIKDYEATDPQKGYNEKAGGQVGSEPNEALRKRLSKLLKTYYKEHPEAREKISKRVLGFRHSEESKEKMRAAKLGKTFKQTDEWKKHIGESNRKRMMSDRDLYEDTCKRCRENGNKSARPVIQMSLDGVELAVYKSGRSAARETGIRDGNISKCCNGKARTAGGYKWRYAM